MEDTKVLQTQMKYLVLPLKQMMKKCKKYIRSKRNLKLRTVKRNMDTLR
jgi:hypothetical protein